MLCRCSSTCRSSRGTGEITLFFATGAATLPQGGLQYQRLINFVDYLSRMSRGRKNNPSLQEPERELVAPNDPEQDAARRELAELLDQLLLELSPEDRTIVLLSQLEDFSAAEIGSELGLSAGAVRTRLSRLRDRLLPALREWPPEK